MGEIGRVSIILGAVSAMILFFSDKSAEKQIEETLTQSNLNVVRSCQGELGEEFGFVHPRPKTILFLSSTDGIPEIATARIKDRNESAVITREIQSQKANDLNHFLIENSGVLAEHGKLSDLQAIDSEKGTRRFDSMMEEALWLCSSEQKTWEDRDAQMKSLKDEILKKATAYIIIEWPVSDTKLSMEVFYEVNGKTFKSDIKPESSQI